MSRNSVEQKVGYAWALGGAACVFLSGVVSVVIPVGLIFGEEAARWSMGVVGVLTAGMTWLFGEAVHAWRLDQGEGEPVPLQAVVSSRR